MLVETGVSWSDQDMDNKSGEEKRPKGKKAKKEQAYSPACECNKEHEDAGHEAVEASMVRFVENNRPATLFSVD